MIRLASILIVVVGVLLGVLAVVQGKQEPPATRLAGAPSINPFSDGIAAAGVVEARTRNITIGAPEQGLVKEVLVEVNQHVARDEPLFLLDNRVVEADLKRAHGALAVAESQLARLEAPARAEEGPTKTTDVDREKARLADAVDQFTQVSVAGATDAATRYEISRRRFYVDQIRAELEHAQAEYELWSKGPWEQDILVARAQVAQARAAIEALELLDERLIVRSPIDGTVLKRRVEPGQFLANTTDTLVVGDISSLNIRAHVDEEDAPRLRDGARAAARMRGMADTMIPLSMLRIEPLAMRKTDLTGETTERTDTRIIEVVFTATPGPGIRLYPGQLLDVFIEAVEPSTGTSASPEEQTKTDQKP